MTAIVYVSYRIYIDYFENFKAMFFLCCSRQHITEALNIKHDHV